MVVLCIVCDRHGAIILYLIIMAHLIFISVVLVTRAYE